MTDVVLRGITIPTGLDNITNADELIAYCARVSNPSNQMNTLTAPKLVKYLYQHGHWSPFEMVSATLEINTTRDLGRQLLRHRSFSFQEFSQRYADPRSSLGFTTREARLQDAKNRQASIDIDDEELHAKWLEKQAEVVGVSNDAYAWAIEAGIAKEVARSVLPEGLIKTRMYMSGTIRSWIHFVQVRTHISTQKETRELANQIKSIILDNFPSLIEVFDIPVKID